AERHRARHVLRGTENDGDDGDEGRARLRDDRRPSPLAKNVPPPPKHAREGGVEARPLLVLAAEKRDALAVLAEAREPVAVLGLRLVLVLRHADEAAAMTSIAPLAITA